MLATKKPVVKVAAKSKAVRLTNAECPRCGGLLAYSPELWLHCPGLRCRKTRIGYRPAVKGGGS